MGSFGNLFNPNQMIVGKEDAANNFARGHYTIGREILSICLERVRHLAENCDNLQGFMFTGSIGGGTGSGLGSLLLEALSSEFGKLSKLAFSIFPSPRISTSVVEPYNAVLASHYLIEHTDVTLMLDNEAIYGICRDSIDISQPTYSDLNRLISQVMSSLTTSLRFSGALNVDINEFQTNLVPYPRIHFVTASYSPLSPVNRAKHERFSVSELTSSVFNKRSMLCRCQTCDGSFMAACLMYRGDVTPKEVNTAVNRLRSRGIVQFTSWSPTGFKFGISQEPPRCTPHGKLTPTNRAVSLIANNTATHFMFNDINAKFDKMFRKRAFVHWFMGEGMEESEISMAREDLEQLERDYKDIDTNSREELDED